MARLTSRSRVLFILLCLALSVCDSVGASQLRSNQLAKRQILPFPDDTTTTEPTTTRTTQTTTDRDTTTTSTSTTTDTTPVTTPPTTTTQTTNPNTNTNTNTAPPTTTTTENTQTTPTTTEPPTPTQEEPPDVLSTSTSTDANGSVVVVTTFVTSSVSSTSASASASETSSSDDSSSGVSTGSIIAMSVAGGVAVIGVVAFFIWKFTRKRYTDFDDEPIKWPELNAHTNENYELPSDRSKTAGAGTGLDSASEVNMNRGASVAAYSAYSQPSQYSHPTAADSTADLYAPGGDPYAVPPLPHMNPNQPPYRDEPGFTSQGYYDPYRGPVPQAFNDTASISSHGPHPGEAIPMSNLGVATGRRSPGPQMGLDMGRVSPQPPMAGRQSPGPILAYGPGPGPVMTGRQSPGPGPAYGGGY